CSIARRWWMPAPTKRTVLMRRVSSQHVSRPHCRCHPPAQLPALAGFLRQARARRRFVLLDTVQCPRTSKGTWINRVKLLVGGVARWVTVPIVRSGGSTLAIEHVRIDDSQPWRSKLARTIELNYRRASAFAEVFPLVSELV